MAATGKVFPAYRKDSLLLFYNEDTPMPEGSTVSQKKKSVVWRFYDDVKFMDRAPRYFLSKDEKVILDGESISLNNNEASSVTGLFPIASEPDNNGKRTVFMPSLQDMASSNNSTPQLVRNLTLYDLDIGSDAPFNEYPYGIRVSTPGNVPDLTFGKGGLITDVKGGLRAYKDIDFNEFVVAAGIRRDNGGQLGNEESDYTKTYATGSLKFFVVSDDTLRAITCENMPTFETSGTIPSFRIEVGDFDSDGVKSEIAVVTGSRNDEFYHLYMYKVTYTGGKFSASSIYTETTPFRRFKRPDKYASLFDEKDYGRFSDAAALATGDFDGDGDQELAMACGDFDGEQSILNTVIYKWQEATQNFTKGKTYTLDYNVSPLVTNYDDNNALMRFISNYEGTRTDIVGTFGLNIGAGRFKAVDRDEIVIQMPHSDILKAPWLNKPYSGNDTDYGFEVSSFTFVFLDCVRGSINPYFSFYRQSLYTNIVIESDDQLNLGYMRFGSINDGKYTPSGQVSMKTSYLPHLSSFAVGAFTGVPDYDTRRPCDDLAYSCNPISGDATVTVVSVRGQYLEGGLRVQIPNTNFVGLCGADFYGESYGIGSPLHLMIRNRNNYVALMQVPPFHIDFIPEAWSTGDAHVTPKVTNVSHTGDTLVSYLHSTTTKSSEASKFSTKFTEEAGISVKETAGVSTPEIAGTKAYAETSFTVGVEAQASQAIEQTNSATKSMNMKFESGTNDVDNMVAYESVLHIWRYPVLRPLLQNYRGAVDDNASMFITFTVCDDLVERTGSPGDLYFATHEEGNLFSYPTRVGDIRGYDENKNQMTLGTPITKTADGLLSQTLGIAEGFSSGESTTVTGKVTASMAMSEKVGVEAKVAKASVEVNAHASLTAEVANCETFTKSYDDEEQIKFYAPANPFASYAPFETGTKIFIDEAGVMTVGMFIRNIELKGGSVWSEYYNQKPDYALVLPGKFTRISVVDQGVPRLKWVAYNNKWGALALRGVRLQSTASSLYNDNKILRPGVEYKITVPVYNASFQPDNGVNGVLVRLSYQKQQNDSSRVKIGETTVELGGWKAATENNKATASFTWRVPEDFKAGAYQFCVELDPDNKTDEIHEVWGTKGDFGGNNLGYCDFSVWDGDDFGQVSSLMTPPRTSNGDGTSKHVFAIRKRTAQARSASLLNASSVADGVEIAADNDQTGMDSYSYINITNNGKEPLLNVHFTLGVNETEDEDTPRFRVIKEWIVPGMFQGDTREFVLTYPYEELIAAAKEGKLEFRVSNPNAKISYTYSEADFDVEEEEKKEEEKKEEEKKEEEKKEEEKKEEEKKDDEDDSGHKESHGTPLVKAEFKAISEKARENFATPAVKTNIENKVKELLGGNAAGYPFFSELPAGAVSTQPAKKVTADQLASVITTGRKSFDISPLTFPTVSVDKPGVYPLGAVPTTNLAEGMELYVYMLVVDEAKGTVRLAGADFFDMKVAADATEGAFFTDDAGNVITRVPEGLDVNIWAPLSAGVEYTPVVALAEDDSDGGVGSSSGGCSAGVAGAGILFALAMLMAFRRTTR